MVIELVALTGRKNDFFVIKKVNITDVIFYRTRRYLKSVSQFCAFDGMTLAGQISEQFSLFFLHSVSLYCSVGL